MDDTRSKLIVGVLETIRAVGIAGASARNVAAAAGVNQALVFYHFGTVAGLIEAASNSAVDEAIARYRMRLATARRIEDLLAIGADLRAQEHENGLVMAQVLAGAGRDPVLARAGRYAVEAWTDQIARALRRLLQPSPLSGLADPDELAPLIAAAFIGLELVGQVDPVGAEKAYAGLGSVGELASSVLTAGPVAQRAIRAVIHRRR